MKAPTTNGGKCYENHTGHRQEDHHRSLELSRQAERNEHDDYGIHQRRKQEEVLYRLHQRALGGMYQEQRQMRYYRQEAHKGGKEGLNDGKAHNA